MQKENKMKYYNVYFYKQNNQFETKCRVYTELALSTKDIRNKLKNIGYENISISYISILFEDSHV